VPDNSLQSERDEPPSPNETLRLLDRIKDGDEDAVNHLLVRLGPRLRRWAHGRLPQSSRGMLETSDIVQDVMVSAIRHLANFNAQGGGLASYLRTSILNRVATEWRKGRRSPEQTSLPDGVADGGTSPLDLAIGAENRARFEESLARLEPEERELIILRFEWDYSHAEIARFLGKPSPDAARVALHRAVKRLTEEVRRG
jgi:RNA polymerase sigma factor (sigma-70 family)